MQKHYENILERFSEGPLAEYLRNANKENKRVDRVTVKISLINIINGSYAEGNLFNIDKDKRDAYKFFDILCNDEENIVFNFPKLKWKRSEEW